MQPGWSGHRACELLLQRGFACLKRVEFGLQARRAETIGDCFNQPSQLPLDGRQLTLRRLLFRGYTRRKAVPFGGERLDELGDEVGRHPRRV